MTKETSMEHSAEWYRGALCIIEGRAKFNKKAYQYYYGKLLEAEAREAGEPGMAEQLAEARERIAALEDAMNPQDVAAVDAGLRAIAEQLEAAKAEARELRELARNLRSEHSLINADAIIGHEWFVEVFGKRMNSFDFASKVSIASTLLAAREARMKALGAIEALEDIAKDSGVDGGKAYFATVVYREFPDRLTTQIGVVEAADIMQRAAQLRQQAEAARLAEELCQN